MVNKVTPDTMLSASRLPAAMGLSKYSTPNDELEYSIRALNGEERPDISNEAMDWGNAMEPLILHEAAKRLQLADLQTEHLSARYHPSCPLCCSLDGTGDGRGQIISTDPDQGIYVIGQDSIQLDGVGVLEAKNTSMDVEDIPPLWRGPIQLQAQMDIIGAKWGAVCTLYRGSRLRIYLFAPHQGTVDMIRDISLDFQSRLDAWRMTGEVQYYSPMAGEKWSAHRGEYPVKDEAITLDAHAERLAQRILSANAVIKEAEATKEMAETELKNLLGTATKATAGAISISWPIRNYKAQPEKITPARDAYTVRQSTLTIRELK